MANWTTDELDQIGSSPKTTDRLEHGRPARLSVRHLWEAPPVQVA
jgi:hypothetical protein